MNTNGPVYSFRSPRSIGKPTTSEKEMYAKVDLTPKKKINIDISKANLVMGENSQRPLQQVLPQSQKVILNANQQTGFNSH